MPRIEKEQCSVCSRHVSFGTLYRRKYSYMCSWCKTSFEKGRTYNKETKKWSQYTPAQKRELAKLSYKKNQIKKERAKEQFRHSVITYFTTLKKQKSVPIARSLGQQKAIESFFLED